MASDSPVSVARTVTFRAFLASDGKTPATGKTIAITISKNGATSFSNPNAGATNATEMASGFYKVTFDTTDMGTAGPFSWRGAEGTINDVGDNFDVVDANRGKLGALPSAAVEASGGLATLSAAQASNGTLPANVHRWLTATPNALISGRADVSIGNVQNGVNALVRAGTAQSVGATSLVMDSAASYADNVLIGNTAKLTSGAHLGATGIVTANVGATDTLTIGGGWSGGVTPTGTPDFELYSSAAGAGVAQTGDAYAIVNSGTHGNAAIKAETAAILADTAEIGTAGAGLTALGDTRIANLDATVSSRAAAALFTGITSVAQWLGLIAGKQAGNSTARTEVRATGAGSGTFDETTDSVEALRDRGDAAWDTATGFSTHSAADAATAVRSELTTELGRIDAAVSTRATPAQVATELGTYDGPTNAEMEARTLAAASYATAANLATVDMVVDAILAMIDDPRGEPGTGAPAVNPDLATKLDYIYKWTRNKKSNDGATTSFYADDGTTVHHTQTTTEAAGTVTKGEIGA